MDFDLLFKNILLPADNGMRRCDLSVKDGRIISMGENISGKATEVISGNEQLLLLPGGVDVHTHLDLQVGRHHVTDGWQQGFKAALTGGTTTVIEHISFGTVGCTPLQSLEQAEKRLAAADLPPNNIRLHGVIQNVDDSTPGQLEQLARRGIRSVKAYMTYDYAIHGHKLAELCRYTRDAGLLLCVHCEDDTLLRHSYANLANSGHLNISYQAAARPPRAEAAAIRELLEAAHLAGDAPIYIVHLSTAEGLRLIRTARERGQQNIYCETCPQYLLFTDELYRTDMETALRAACSPPLRQAADCSALWQGLADGTIDVLATDHCYFSLTQKLPYAADLRTVPNGIPGVHERLMLLFSEGVAQGRITPERAVDVACTRPAQLFDCKGKGILQPGADADLLLFDPAAPPSHLPHTCADSLYANMDLKGHINRIWLAGHPITIS